MELLLEIRVGAKRFCGLVALPGCSGSGLPSCGAAAPPLLQVLSRKPHLHALRAQCDETCTTKYLRVSGAESRVLKAKGLPWRLSEAELCQFFQDFALLRVVLLPTADGRPSGMVSVAPFPRRSHRLTEVEFSRRNCLVLHLGCCMGNA